jgi:DNA-binding MurR/RpiR family transcriptional regulator
MVSVDHFAHELRTQLRNAAAQGATTIVITSGDF